ncbi:MAG: 50S ribosomal protein L18e [Desulfurococcales archaeon]|nr:50S ribosomal protein L18e [Desulfurococcales archaeon]
MGKRTGPTNIVLRKTADKLMKAYEQTGSKVWRDIAEHLLKPARQKVYVNLSKINRYTREGDIVVVPGKVLGSGALEKKVTVAAFSFSEKAVEKIENSGSSVVTINELLEKGVSSSDVKIIV